MSKFGVYFFSKERDLFCCCPHCKSSTLFDEPESNRDAFITLLNLSNNRFALKRYVRSQVTDFSVWDSEDKPISSTSNAVLINLDNISDYQTLPRDAHFVTLYSNSSNHRESILMRCNSCNEEAQYFAYTPDLQNLIPFYIGSTFGEDDKKINFNIKGFFMTFINNKIQTHHYMTRIVFNKATGRVTILQPLGVNNKPMGILPKYAKMWNVTFGKINQRMDFNFLNENEVMNDFSESVIPLLLRGLQEKFPYIKDDHFDECLKETRVSKDPVDGALKTVPFNLNFVDVLRSVIRKFRFHDLSKEFLDTIPHDSHYNTRSKIMTRVSYKSQQQLTDLLNIVGRKLPKTLRKEAIKSLSALLFVKDVDFIKSPANMKKMIACYANSTRFSDSSRIGNEFEPFFLEYMDALALKNSANFKNKDKLYEHCETIFVNRVTAKDSSRWIYDTYQQLMQIRREDGEYKIDTDLTLRQLHDDVSSALRKIKTKNRELSYTDEEKSVEWLKGSYSFRLSQDTHHLVDVGAQMNICVGGYGDSAVCKSLHIVVVSTPDNDYECCIEMSADMKKVRQAKIRHNGRPKDELLEVIMKWVEEKNLQIDTRDLPGKDDMGPDMTLRRAEYVIEIEDEEDDFVQLEEAPRALAFG